MLTWWSDRALATSRSSRERSRATTSTPARNTDARALAVPVDLDQAGGVVAHQRHRVGAVGAVDADAAATGDEADDLVAGHRRAALGQAHEHVVEPLDVDADLVGLRAVAARPQHGGRQLLLVVAAAEAPGDALGDAPRRHVVLADRRQQGVEVDVAVVGDDGLELVRRPHPLHRQALPAELLGELVAALLDHVEAPLAAEPLADLVARPRRRRRSRSQSCDGPAVSTFDVKISHVSPLASWWSSDTRRPLTLAPMQAWPTSVCTA